jgi:hypothetical protein
MTLTARKLGFVALALGLGAALHAATLSEMADPNHRLDLNQQSDFVRSAQLGGKTQTGKASSLPKASPFGHKTFEARSARFGGTSSLTENVFQPKGGNPLDKQAPMKKGVADGFQQTPSGFERTYQTGTPHGLRLERAPGFTGVYPAKKYEGDLNEKLQRKLDQWVPDKPLSQEQIHEVLNKN